MTASPPRSILPPLSAEERHHSLAVAELIRGQLQAAGGWLSFERFMELALYAPGLGYYSAGAAKIGAGGDFVTAPEVSELFSRCVARQCAQVLAGTRGEILELGAGTGRMAAVILCELAVAEALPARYAILEVSADLRQRQQALLAELPQDLRERVVWLDSLPQQPFAGMILANEVADALPCRRFTCRGSGVRELGISLAPASEHVADTFQEQFGNPDPALAQACRELRGALSEPLPEGYTSEVCLRLEPWIASLGACLARGAILISDYGLPRRHYYHPQRVSGTLRCHFKQLAHEDPCINVGVQDISAWVDFTRLANAAVSANLAIGGFATQAAFLLGLGLEAMVGEEQDPVQQARLAGEARRLIMPEEMGEAFKFMALTRGYDKPLAGFQLQDLRDQL
jgi:SAM-dependent MidA family methyltransferase